MSDDQDFGLWDTTKGLISEYEGVVREATFGYDSRYNNGETLLLMLTLDVDPEVSEDGERTEMFTVGGGWEDIDGGEGCQNKRGVEGGTARSALFNDASGCGLLVNAVKEAEGFDPSLIANPYKASSWVGLGMELEGKEFTNTIRGEERTYTRTLPKRVWRGEQEAAAPAAKPAAKAPAEKKPAGGAAAAKAKAAAAKAKAAAGGDDEGPLVAAARAIAAECSTYDEFVERAYMEVEGLADDVAAQAIVDDPSNFPNLG